MYDNKLEDIISAQSGNQNAMTKLVTENSNLIWSIVRRFKDRGYEIEDLYQIGCIGFIKAIKRFETKYEVKLSTYAVPYILGEIKIFIRDDGPVKISRSIKDLAVKISLVKNEYLNKKGIELNVDEIAKILKISKEDVIIAMESCNNVDSIDKNINDSEDITILDRLKSNKDEENELINKITVESLIADLEESEKKIIMMRYYRGKTQTQVAKMLGISQVQVSRLEKKILGNMKNKLVCEKEV